MKHFYNLSSAANTLQSTTSALGTALSGKIISLLFVCFFLLVSGESMGQGGVTVYNNPFTTQAQQNATASLTKGLGPTYPSGELTIETTGSGTNGGYQGWIYISTNYQAKIGYSYTFALNARVSGSGTNKNGAFSVKVGSDATNFSTGGVVVIPTTELSDNNTTMQNFISSSMQFASQQTLVVAIYINGSRNNAAIHFDDIVITETCAPAAPQVTSAATCASSGSLTLSATGATGSDYYRWYRVAEGGTAIAGQNGPQYTTEVLTQTTTYYVSIVNGVVDCESRRVPVTASIAKLTAPTVTSDAQCSNGARTITFTASGAGANEDYRWYNSSDVPVATGSTITRSTNTQGDPGVYYVVKFSTVTAGCESDKTYLVVPTNDPTPSKPANLTASRCVGGSLTIEPVAELGMTYRWYNSSGQYLADGLTYTIASVSSGTTTYSYRKVNTATGCMSDPATVTVTGASAIAATGDIVQPENPVVGQPATFSFTSNIPAQEIASYQWFYHETGSSADTWVRAANTPNLTFGSMPGNIDGVKVELTVSEQNAACYTNLLSNRIYEISNASITPLPVELISFNAQRHTQGVNLTWVTASELDNKGFEVQVSTDSRNFTTIGFVESKVGTTVLKQYYNFLDTKAVSGTRYYRLKQIDFDGKSAFSNIKAVSLNGNNGVIAAYPNPFDDVVIVTLNGTEARNVHVILTNTMGKVVHESLEETSGNSISVDMTKAAAKGMYMLHVMDNGSKHVFKLMKR
ncbi:T9SS type A sorting domain-containing protein [uncultured Pontibacter sp.]|uniref:Ig-like domain-containing protein n=1 Tax=uncultured Pontibacter sp. TaxID=453356 RepID=UPI0026100903|nr:T9SS type A sorting domain-containing protein [uncultured Pontibacter sp.]